MDPYKHFVFLLVALKNVIKDFVYIHMYLNLLTSTVINQGLLHATCIQCYKTIYQKTLFFKDHVT